MIYAVLLTVGGIAQIAAGWRLGLWGVPVVWSGLAWTIVGAGYAGVGPRVFGKRSDGSLPRVRTLLVLPFLIVNWAVWRLARRRSGCCHEIAPGIWLGRFPLRGDLPAGTTAVVDLTAEFPRSVDVGERAYLCDPLLDGTAPDTEQLDRLLAWIDEQKGPVYIHCAAGHGRSATLVAAALIRRGLARDVPEALRLIAASRPRARPKRVQVRSLESFAKRPPRPLP